MSLNKRHPLVRRFTQLALPFTLFLINIHTHTHSVTASVTLVSQQTLVCVLKLLLNADVLRRRPPHQHA